MDARKLALLEALKLGARAEGELPLYRRGKSPGLFDQRTRVNAEAASQAVADGLLEVTRVETAGKTSVEWVKVTQAGLTHLLDSESPARALDELREALALNQQGLPKWAAEMRERINQITSQFNTEVTTMRERLEQMAQQVDDVIARMEANKQQSTPIGVAWAHETLDLLERRQQVGLGTRCSLADLFTSLKETHPKLTIKEFHHGLLQLSAAQAVTLMPSAGNGDAPAPEFALLDGPSLYYYVARAAA